MKYSFTSAALFASQALAFPFVLDEVKQAQNTKRTTGPAGLPNPLPAAGSSAAKALSASRGNCGLIPCLVFNEEEQYVSNTGTYAFKAPGSSDIRGLSLARVPADLFSLLSQAHVRDSTLPPTMATSLTVVFRLSSVPSPVSARHTT